MQKLLKHFDFQASFAWAS